MGDDAFRELERSQNNGPPRVSIFVYGTLKVGQRNHAAYCRSVVAVTPAVVWGRLYHLSARGYPILEVPPASILAQGTGDYLADAIRLDAAPTAADLSRKHPIPAADVLVAEGTPDWERIEGEILTFADPRVDLPLLDALETFDPHGSDNEYDRVLIVAAEPRMGVWTYVAPPGPLPEDAVRIGTSWPGSPRRRA